jgi:hypothetical protein
MKVFTALVTLLSILAANRAHAETLPKHRGQLYYKGTMTQTAPLQWEGPFALYLQFDPEVSPPQPIVGVIMWPTLGGAKTKIKGTQKSPTRFEFIEESCAEGDCSQIVLGGHYITEGDSELRKLRGTATGTLGLTGRFKLERFDPR